MNIPNIPREEAIRNASLAAMQLMLATKANGLDSSPMGGYDVDRFIKAFNIPSRYVPVMLIAIGKAAIPARPSTRFPVEKTIVWNGF
jgi:nitroreductase